MVIARHERRTAREPRVRELFAEHTEAVLDALELVEFAWHDCYGEVSPPDRVVQDILTCSQCDLATLLRAARLAVEDARDLRQWAQEVASEAAVRRPRQD